MISLPPLGMSRREFVYTPRPHPRSISIREVLMRTCSYYSPLLIFLKSPLLAASSWLYIYPPGFRELLLYIKENYANPTVYITENGVDEVNNNRLPLQEALKDDTRIEDYHKHLLYLLSAIRDGANVKGYFAWSLLDNFEWMNGYAVRFGITLRGLQRRAEATPQELRPLAHGVPPPGTDMDENMR